MQDGEWLYQRALVLRSSSEHDLQPQDQSDLSVEEGGRTDAAAQVPHKKGETTLALCTVQDIMI